MSEAEPTPGEGEIPEQAHEHLSGDKPSRDLLNDVDRQFQDKLIIKKGVEKAQILKTRNGLLSQDERRQQEGLEKKWEEGQKLDETGISPAEKTVVSFSPNYGDLKKDIRLLSLSLELPERRRTQMEQRGELVSVLGKYLEKIPEGKAKYYLISSGSPSENEAIPAGIEDSYFDELIAEIQQDCPSDEEMGEWRKGQKKNFPGKKFFISFRAPNRCHVTLLEGDEGYPTAVQFEIARLQADQKIVFDSSKYFDDEKFRKFGSPDETGKKLEKASNAWIEEQRVYLGEYQQLYEQILGLPIPDWEKEPMQKTAEFLFFILRCGKTKFSGPREIGKGEFMTNNEDALVTIRDFKFNTYGIGVFHDSLLKMKKLAEANKFQHVSNGLDFLLTEDIS